MVKTEPRLRRLYLGWFSFDEKSIFIVLCVFDDNPRLGKSVEGMKSNPNSGKLLHVSPNRSGSELEDTQLQSLLTLSKKLQFRRGRGREMKREKDRSWRYLFG